MGSQRGRKENVRLLVGAAIRGDEQCVPALLRGGGLIVVVVMQAQMGAAVVGLVCEFDIVMEYVAVGDLEITLRSLCKS